MRKSTVMTTQDSVGSYETEIFSCETPARIIIGVHGNGVRRWDGEKFFYEVADHYADSTVMLADLNQQEPDGVKINPLTIMVNRVEGLIAAAKSLHKGIPIVIVAHSMGCAVTAQVDLKDVSAVFFVAPAVGAPQQDLIKRYGADVADGKTVISSDGLSKIITKDYFDSVTGLTWEEEYKKLANRYSPVYVYEAGEDEILDERRFTHRTISFTGYEIIQSAKHNFCGMPLKTLFSKMDNILMKVNDA